jgi:hypothetical protein
MKVNCIHLSPPRVDIERWHCEIGDGYEGDCPIFLNKSTHCSYKEETTMELNTRDDGTPATIIIKSNAKPTHLAHLFFGGFIVLALLAIPIPFFRYTLTFSSLFLAIACSMGAYTAWNDKTGGVKRIKPDNWGNSVIPRWFKTGFFIFMIIVTAGLRLGFYLVPIAWIINWVMLYSILNHIKATFVPKDHKWPSFEDCLSDKETKEA